MKTITYLLGAGASRNSLPIVKEIPDALEKFNIILNSEENVLSKEDIYESTATPLSKNEWQKEFIKSIRTLREIAIKHASIDTYAKKIFVKKKKEELKTLKIILACFFIYEQMTKPVDYRYDSFIASLINPTLHGNMLPDNVRILTWNYDFQFEKAISDYLTYTNNTLKQIQTQFNIHPSFASEFKANTDHFGVYKLNGSTCFYDEYNREYKNLYDDIYKNNKIDLIERIVKIYALFTSTIISPLMIKFAWEKDDLTKTLLSNALESSRETEVLVVIGYSFPFFNREIDRQIIRNMSKLEKIYFQAPKEDVIKYPSRFQSIIENVVEEGIKIELLDDTDQFFLPPEL